jgi:hypothetical protein
MVEAAELALETLSERNQMILKEQREIEVEEPNDIRKDGE